MARKFWRGPNGKLLVDANGHLYYCENCPCTYDDCVAAVDAAAERYLVAVGLSPTYNNALPAWENIRNWLNLCAGYYSQSFNFTYASNYPSTNDNYPSNGTYMPVVTSCDACWPYIRNLKTMTKSLARLANSGRRTQYTGVLPFTQALDTGTVINLCSDPNNCGNTWYGYSVTVSASIDDAIAGLSEYLGETNDSATPGAWYYAGYSNWIGCSCALTGRWYRITVQEYASKTKYRLINNISTARPKSIYVYTMPIIPGAIPVYEYSSLNALVGARDEYTQTNVTDAGLANNFESPYIGAYDSREFPALSLTDAGTCWSIQHGDNSPTQSNSKRRGFVIGGVFAKIRWSFTDDPSA